MPSENNKRIAKNTLFLYFRMLLTMGVSLYTSRVVLATLGIEDFGIYNVVGGIVAMLGFINGALGGATSRFLTFEMGQGSNEEKLQKTFSATLTIHLLLAFIICILAETIGLWFLENKLVIPIERMYAAHGVYHFSVVIVMLNIIQVPYSAAIIAHERMNIFAYISILDTSLKLLVVYLLAIGNFDKLILYSALMFLVSILNLLIHSYYSHKKFKECKFELTKDKTLIKPILSFSGWSLMGCGALIGSTQGVNILLNMFFGPIVNAARGISVQVNTAVTGFVTNFQTAVNPQIIKLYAAEKREELLILLFQNSKFSFCLVWFLSLPVFLKIEVILNIWLINVPEYTPLFCRLIILQSLIYCTQRPFVMACHAIGKMKMFQLLTTPPLLLVLPISYFFIKLGYPNYVPFVIYIIMTIIEYLIELFLLRRWIKLSYLKFLNTVLRPIFIVIISSFLLPFILYLTLDDSYLSFFFICFISMVNVALSTFYFAFDKYLRKKITNFVAYKILKNGHRL